MCTLGKLHHPFNTTANILKRTQETTQTPDLQQRLPTYKLCVKYANDFGALAHTVLFTMCNCGGQSDLLGVGTPVRATRVWKAACDSLDHLA